MLKKASILIIFIFLSVVLFAESEFETELEAEIDNEEAIEKKANKREDFFFGVGGDLALYSAYGYSYGGSVIFGYGTGTAMGIKAFWFFSPEEIDTAEINALIRFYLKGADSYQGPFLQVMGGASVYFKNGYFSFPFKHGSISAGLCFGWRFIFAKYLFAEPYIRAGYPFAAGAGVNAGFRF
ncbi:MAG: hypothetical protein LBU83_12530 [Bacteroidales bacterium]|jgi:hypothetical protein|nr:hypothetical protein [Bacteroidales bacterium]